MSLELRRNSVRPQRRTVRAAEHQVVLVVIGTEPIPLDLLSGAVPGERLLRGARPAAPTGDPLESAAQQSPDEESFGRLAAVVLDRCPGIGQLFGAATAEHYGAPLPDWIARLPDWIAR